MTLRRLRWLLYPLFAAVALAVLALPPRAVPEKVGLVSSLLGFGGATWRESVRDRHRWSIDRMRQRLRADVTARTHGAADVLASRTARALRLAGESVVMVRDGDVPDAAARAWLRAVERELATVPRAATRGAPVIVALHTRSPNESSYSTSGEPQSGRFQFGDGGTRACIVDILFPKKGERGRGRFDVPQGLSGRVLGRCALYARYGFPGLDVQRWAGLEARWSGMRSWWYGGVGMFVPQRFAPDTLHFRPTYGGVAWTELGCFRGVDSYCAALFGLGSRAAIERARDIYYYGWEYGPPSDRLVADVILHRGPDRFVKFWTSSLPADSALSAAYGVPAGALAREAFSRRFLPEPPAQPGGAMMLVSVGWAIALAVLAMVLSWRREMDA
ncbi:MAG: hypothetical protein ABSB58_00175 [Gemmatimonadales bacterium]|jgi:hypothetical protein